MAASLRSSTHGKVEKKRLNAFHVSSLRHILGIKWSTRVPNTRIQAKEMGRYRKILHISYKDHVTSEEVRAKIQQEIGQHEDLLTIVKRRKLKWYGHVSRSSGLAKTIL